MKRCLCVLVFLLALAAPCFAESAVPDSWNETIAEAPMTLEEFQQEDAGGWLSGILTSLRQQLRSPLALLGKLCGVLILAAAVQALCSSKGTGDVGELVEIVVALAAFSLCAGVLTGLLQALGQALESSKTYLVSFIPVFASALTACGQPGGAAIYSGLFFTVASLVATVLCSVGLPLVRICIAFGAADSAGAPLELGKLSSGLCKWIQTLLGFCATVFTALMTLQGVFAQSADSVALKTGKFLLGSSVPVVGRAISDAMGGVLAGLKLLKGSLGFAAVAVIAALFLPLIVECFLYQVVFAVSGMVAAALGSKRAEQLFSSLADCVGLCMSMAFFFSFLVVCTTMLMILFGSGG